MKSGRESKDYLCVSVEPTSNLRKKGFGDTSPQFLDLFQNVRFDQ